MARSTNAQTVTPLYDPLHGTCHDVTRISKWWRPAVYSYEIKMNTNMNNLQTQQLHLYLGMTTASES
jgi:hypothetical protein